MPLKQVGGRGKTAKQRKESEQKKNQRNTRKRSLKKQSNKRKKALREKGYELKNRIFLDTNNYGILKQLKLKTSYKVSKYFIDAHGTIKRDHFKVPDNIVLMYLGVIGNVTIIDSLYLIGHICNGFVTPNNIILPGEMAPNVSMSGEKYKKGISGIFECGFPPKRVLNNYLVPKQDVIDSYINFQGDTRDAIFGFEIMKDPETGEYPISTENNYQTDLEKTVYAISELLNKNTYAFVYVDACLSGGCGMPMTREEFNTIVNPEKFNTLRTGDKLYDENPYRLRTIRGSLKSDKTIVDIHEMQHAEDRDHDMYRGLLQLLIDDYNFSTYNFAIYQDIKKYYEYDINDLPYFSRYANESTTEDRDFSHYVEFTDMHVKILKAFKKQDRDEIFKLTRRENALRFNINPIKYAFLARKYGMTDIPLASLHGNGIFKDGDDATQVNKNIKDINELAKKLSKSETPPSIFLYTLWEQYTKNPLLRSNDDTLFSDFWFDGHEEIEKLKKKERLTKSQRIKLKKLQNQHDYYTITSFMVEIIQTIDLYEERSEGANDFFKTNSLPSYNISLVKELMTIALEYVSSDDYKRREIAFKDKIIKQLEDINTMIENHGSQTGGDFLSAIFKFFGF